MQSSSRHHSVFTWAKGKRKHFPVRTPPEFDDCRHGHRSNFSGLTDDVIAQNSLFLTLLTLSDRLLPLWLSLPSFVNIALPASNGPSHLFSLCFLQAVPSIFLPYKAGRQSHTPRLKKQDRNHETKKITGTISFYLCLFFLFHICLTL